MITIDFSQQARYNIKYDKKMFHTILRRCLTTQ